MEDNNKVERGFKCCPFCGSKNIAFVDHYKGCFLRILEEDFDFYTQEDYRLAWNTRVKDKDNRILDEKSKLREKYAGLAMQGILANSAVEEAMLELEYKKDINQKEYNEVIASISIEYANTLIKQLDKESKDNE